MNFEIFNKYKAVISKILAGLCVLLAILICIKIASIGAGKARIERWDQAVTDSNSVAEPNEETPKAADPYAELIAKLKEENLFFQKKPPTHSVSGILGDEALINGKWYKAGDKIGDANVVKIMPTYVTIEYNGQTKNYAPIIAAPDPPEEPKAKPEPKEIKPQPAATAPVANATAQKDQAIAENDPLAWMGVELSADARSLLLEQWNKASDEEKSKTKQEWNELSDTEKEKQIAEIEQHTKAN